MPISNASTDPLLLNTVLETAGDAGCNLMTLTRVAGVTPETISQAKRRAAMDAPTLAALSKAAGLQLTLTPKQVGTPDQKHMHTLLAYARREAEQTGRAIPNSMNPRVLADSLNHSGDVLFIPGDPNRDNAKRNIAVQVFLDFSAEDIFAFGAAWLQKWERNSGESWHQEWSEIIARGSASELQDILLSASSQRVRQRSSMPFAEMLGFDAVLAIKRRWRHEKV